MRMWKCWSLGLILVLTLATAPWASADGGVTFQDIAAGDGAGIDYRRAESPSDALFDALKAQPVYTFPDVFLSPIKSRGAPGVAVLDYDGDGDEDLYVTNGPGRTNSLYENQLVPSGTTSFLDVALIAGVDATDQDSTGSATATWTTTAIRTSWCWAMPRRIDCMKIWGTAPSRT